MASPFYIWDAAIHAGLPRNLSQAEELAQQRPAAGISSAKLSAWAKDLKQFVSDPANASALNSSTINYIQSWADWLAQHHEARLELEHIHIEESDYFYKALIESIERHDLAAYDSNRGWFVSQAYWLPEGLKEAVQVEFASVSKNDEPLSLALDVVPKSARQFQDLILAWFEQHHYQGEPFKVWDRDSTGFSLERENDLFHEELFFVAYYRNGPYVSNVDHKISVKSLYPVVGHNRSDPVLSTEEKKTTLAHYSIHPDSLKLQGNTMYFEFTRRPDTTELLQLFFTDLQDYLNMMGEHLQSLEAFNELINHDTKWNISTHQSRSYPGNALPDLALAKHANDPRYDALYNKKMANICDPDWKQRTITALDMVKAL